MDIQILYETHDFLVCVKPAGLLSEEGENSLPFYLKEMTGNDVYAVHRLDRGTGGVMVYAKTKECAAALSEEIRNGNFRKEYLAVVRGAPEAPTGVLKDLLFHDRRANKSYAVKKKRQGVKEASLEYITEATVAQKDITLSLLRIRLYTGRTHQIRVQFSSRHLPLYGDGKYGGRTESEGIALWSCALEFTYPKNKINSFFAAPPDRYPWGLFDINTPVTKNT